MTMALTRLLQLASPTLPVGAYSYSQGLEWAIEAGTVHDEITAARWIGDQLTWNLGRYELPLLARLLAAWQLGDGGTARELDAVYLASRESAELRAETLQMGYSMRRLLDDLEELPESLRVTLHGASEPSFLCVWSAAAALWKVPEREALTGWAWSWAENQVMAALKAVPLGQAAGQRLLRQLGGEIPVVVERALSHDPADDSNFAPGFALACARHETQYSRLFRS
jgi:urease accessory protein